MKLDLEQDVIFHTAGKKRPYGKRNKTRELNGQIEKQCYKCKEWKALDLFHKRKPSGPVRNLKKNSHQSACKSCLNKINSKRYRMLKANGKTYDPR